MLPIVAPANAGVQVPKARRLLPWVPAFAGMTEQERGIKYQRRTTSLNVPRIAGRGPCQIQGPLGTSGNGHFLVKLTRKFP